MTPRGRQGTDPNLISKISPGAHFGSTHVPACVKNISEYGHFVLCYNGPLHMLMAIRKTLCSSFYDHLLLLELIQHTPYFHILCS